MIPFVSPNALCAAQLDVRVGQREPRFFFQQPSCLPTPPSSGSSNEGSESSHRLARVTPLTVRCAGKVLEGKGKKKQDYDESKCRTPLSQTTHGPCINHLSRRRFVSDSASRYPHFAFIHHHRHHLLTSHSFSHDVTAYSALCSGHTMQTLTFTHRLVCEPQELEKAARAVLHLICFHRFLGTVKPAYVELLGMTFVS